MSTIPKPMVSRLDLIAAPIEAAILSLLICSVSEFLGQPGISLVPSCVAGTAMILVGVDYQNRYLKQIRFSRRLRWSSVFRPFPRQIVAGLLAYSVSALIF